MPPSTSIEPPNTWKQLKNAAAQGDVPKIKSLLRAKVSPNPSVRAKTSPLQLAAYNGHVEATELLIQAKANIDARGGDNRWTALMHAAANNKTAVMHVLIEAKAMMDKWGGDSNTALMLAAQKGYNVVVKLLVDANADLDMLDSTDQITRVLGRFL